VDVHVRKLRRSLSTTSAALASCIDVAEVCAIQGYDQRAEIASSLGYSEASAFNHAFRFVFCSRAAHSKFRIGHRSAAL